MTLQTDRYGKGDGEAMIAPAVEARSMLYQRFTAHQHRLGETVGWRFAAGWFLRMGGLEWAWFQKIEEGDRRGSQ